MTSALSDFDVEFLRFGGIAPCHAVDLEYRTWIERARRERKESGAPRRQMTEQEKYERGRRDLASVLAAAPWRMDRGKVWFFKNELLNLNDFPVKEYAPGEGYDIAVHLLDRAPARGDLVLIEEGIQRSRFDIFRVATITSRGSVVVQLSPSGRRRYTYTSREFHDARYVLHGVVEERSSK